MLSSNLRLVLYFVCVCERRVSRLRWVRRHIWWVNECIWWVNECIWWVNECFDMLPCKLSCVTIYTFCIRHFENKLKRKHVSIHQTYIQPTTTDLIAWYPIKWSNFRIFHMNITTREPYYCIRNVVTWTMKRANECSCTLIHYPTQTYSPWTVKRFKLFQVHAYIE